MENIENIENIEVKCRYSINIPSQAHAGEWYDLFTSEEVTLSKGDFSYIDLGVCIRIPKGYEAILVPRSSTFSKWGILQTNSIGVIDNAYAGNDDWWKLPVLATRDITIPKGTKIAQFRIISQQLPAEVWVVERMRDPNRGGLGSTGV